MCHKMNQSDVKPYQCDVCNKQYRYACKLKRHKLGHLDDKPFKCHSCKSQFTEIHSLRRHILLHSDKLVKPYKCEICKEQFDRLNSFKQHTLLHSGEKRHTCDICQKQFTKAGTLRKHKLVHSDEKQHTCDKCQKQFSYRSSFHRHKLVHLDTKPFNCAACNKQYITAYGLRQHIKAVHLNIKSNTGTLGRVSYPQTQKILHSRDDSHFYGGLAQQFSRADNFQNYMWLHSKYNTQIENENIEDTRSWLGTGKPMSRGIISHSIDEENGGCSQIPRRVQEEKPNLPHLNSFGTNMFGDTIKLEKQNGLALNHPVINTVKTEEDDVTEYVRLKYDHYTLNETAVNSVQLQKVEFGDRGHSECEMLKLKSDLVYSSTMLCTDTIKRELSPKNTIIYPTSNEVKTEEDECVIPVTFSGKSDYDMNCIE